MRASLIGHSDVVDVLLKYKADVGKTKNDGYHSVLFASLQGHNVVLQSLLRVGAEWAQKADHTGLTPLMAAAKNGHAVTVRLLLLLEDDVLPGSLPT